MATIMLFVYGTLKRGFTNNSLLDGQEFIRQATTLPFYRLHDSGPYPCLVKVSQNGNAIQGELWKVNDELIPTLDALEGSPELFARQEVAIRDFACPVFAYFYERETSGYRDCGSRWPA